MNGGHLSKAAAWEGAGKRNVEHRNRQSREDVRADCRVLVGGAGVAVKSGGVGVVGGGEGAAARREGMKLSVSGIATSMRMSTTRQRLS
jgi:hypothetical protein